MSNRITKEDLGRVARRLNIVTGNPVDKIGADGNWNHGHFYFDSGCGGYGGSNGYLLRQISTKENNDRNVLEIGYLPAREVLSLTCAYLKAVEDIKYSDGDFFK